MKNLLSIVFGLLLIAACKTQKKMPSENVKTGETWYDASFRKPIKDKGLYLATTEAIPFDTAYITSDTLNIITKKIFGCETGSFKLIWDGALSKATPPQTNVKLLQAVDPNCKDKHKFHLTYNISQLRYKQDTTQNKTTMLRVGGWHEMLKYNF
jgi:hypothetical protein